MAFQQVPNTAEIIVHYALSGRSFVNTYHAEFAGGYSLASLQGMAAAIDAYVSGSWLAAMTVYLQYVKTSVRGLSAENDILVEDSSGAGYGSAGEAPAPVNVAFCIQKLSGLTGRSARGRVYLAGWPISWTQTSTGDANLLQLTHADYLQGAVAGVRAGIALQPNATPVIVSRYSALAKRATAVTFDWVLTDYADLKLDTRRSRIR